MTRDMDLVRLILLRSAEKPDPKPSRNTTFDGYDCETVGYHICLLCQANFLDGFVPRLTNAHSYRHCMIGNLTWEGNEFLDAAKNDSLWNKAKRLVADKGAELTVDALKAALKIVVTSQLSQ